MSRGFTDIEKLLRRVPLFARMSRPELSTLAGHTAVRVVEPGAVVFSPGNFDHRIHIVASGNVIATRANAGGTPQILASFIAGEMLGELELLDPGTTPYEVHATERSEICTVPGGDIDAETLFVRHPDLGATIAKRLLAEISERIRSANTIVSEKAPWIEGLKRQIHTDKLTGLPNAVYLREALPDLLAGSPGRTTILIVKPDNFKTINDTWGHDAGDSVLGLLARAVRTFAGRDTCARFKGDVFCLVLRNADGADDEKRAESLLAVIRGLDLSPFTGGAPFVMTASIGLCETGTTAAEIEHACAAALAVVMTVREEGGDRCVRAT